MEIQGNENISNNLIGKSMKNTVKHWKIYIMSITMTIIKK